MIRRRDFLLGSSALLVAPFGHAQQKPRRIGWLSDRATEFTPLGSIKGGLKRIGYEEGRNLVIESRISVNAGPAALQALAQELVASGVELILVDTMACTRAAKNATKTVPIVMGANIQPVENGLVESYAR